MPWRTSPRRRPTHPGCFREDSERDAEENRPEDERERGTDSVTSACCDGLPSSRSERSSGLPADPGSANPSRNCSVQDNDGVPVLETVGWDDGWDAAFTPHRAAGLEPGRIAVPHRGAYDVLTSRGETRARLPGRARRRVESAAELPVVGDWVALEPGEPVPTIRAVLPRRTQFSRRAAHNPGSDVAREQVVAANVDVVFVVATLTDVNQRVLERYLTLAGRAGRNQSCF